MTVETPDRDVMGELSAPGRKNVHLRSGKHGQVGKEENKWMDGWRDGWRDGRVDGRNNEVWLQRLLIAGESQSIIVENSNVEKEWRNEINYSWNSSS